MSGYDRLEHEHWLQQDGPSTRRQWKVGGEDEFWDGRDTKYVVGTGNADTSQELWERLQEDQAKGIASITGEQAFNTVEDEVAQIRSYDISADDYDTDLTDLRTITIDPGNAHDYDDAISIAEQPDGYTVYVHIADVPFYVEQGGRVEEEAFQNGRSTYYDGTANHMLPDELARELSLLEDTERLTNTVELGFDEDLYPTGDHDIYKALVEVDRNLSYKEATDRAKTVKTEPTNGEQCDIKQRIRDELGDAKPARSPYVRAQQKFGTAKEDTSAYDTLSTAEQQLVDDIELLQKAAHHLADERRDDVAYGRDAGHIIVEEFMLYANQICAEQLTEKPFGVYRVHGRPQTDWEAAIDEYFAEHLGTEPGRIAEAHDPLLELERVDEEYDDHEIPVIFAPAADERQWAYHSPVNRGHEALGFEAYAPFTSPIRRAADIVNWRILNDEFDKDHTEVIRLVNQWNQPARLRDHFHDEEAETATISQFDTPALDEEPLLPAKGYQ